MEEEIIACINQKIEKTNNCWTWLGLLDKNNKPLLIIKGKQFSVRKYIPLLFGKSPAQDRVHDTCGNNLCVNPDHLVSGDVARFWSKVSKPDFTDCWLWIGLEDKNGYGKFSINNGKTTIKSHRYSWELYTGRVIPPNLLACHKCDNPRCVNPHHLFLGTNLDNMQDRDSKGRKNTPTGARSSFSKLKDKQVLEIRSSNKTVKELTIIYNVSDETVYSILNRKTWKHI